MAQNEIVRHFDGHRNTKAPLWRRYLQQGNMTCNGTLVHMGRYVNKRTVFGWSIYGIHTTCHIITSRTIPGLRPISVRTVLRELREHNILPRRPAICPISLPRHRQGRLARCWQHLRFRRQDRGSILYPVQSRFYLDSSDGSASVYRGPWERFATLTLLNAVMFVWKCNGMGWPQSTENRTVHCEWQFQWRTLPGRHRFYFILPFVQIQGPHVAHVTDFLMQHNAAVLIWLTVAQGLSTIEHIWAEIERRLWQDQN